MHNINDNPTLHEEYNNGGNNLSLMENQIVTSR